VLGTVTGLLAYAFAETTNGTVQQVLFSGQEALDPLLTRAVDATVGHPPGFYLWPVTKGAAWPGDGDAIVRECDQFLSTVPDVSAKLAASGLSERHAVVVVTVDWFQLFASVEYGALPAIPPSLPEGVDCLWLITLKSPPIRAAYWLGDRTWRGTTLTADHLGMAELSAL